MPRYSPGGVLQLEQRRAVAVQERVGHRVAARDPLVPAAKGDRDMGEGPGLVGLRRDLIEDQPARLVDADAALDQVVGEAAFEMQLAGQIIDGGDAIALGFAGAGGSPARRCRRAGVFLRLRAGLRRLAGLATFGSGVSSPVSVVGHAGVLGIIRLGRLGAGWGRPSSAGVWVLSVIGDAPCSCWGASRR
jgi:hypothetical protein